MLTECENLRACTLLGGVTSEMRVCVVVVTNTIQQNRPMDLISIGPGRCIVVCVQSNMVCSWCKNKMFLV